MQTPPSTTTRFDAIVVGSGASGGWVAKRLCEAGVKVALLDAGRAHGPGDYALLRHRRGLRGDHRDR